MNKYKVKTRDVYDLEVSVFFVEADKFYAEGHTVTFVVKEDDSPEHSYGEAVAFYNDVVSVVKVKNE